jgi:hypothetical protein
VDRPDDGCVAETCSLVYYSNIYCCARLYLFVPIDISQNGMDSVKKKKVFQEDDHDLLFKQWINFNITTFILNVRNFTSWIYLSFNVYYTHKQKFMLLIITSLFHDFCCTLHNGLKCGPNLYPFIVRRYASIPRFKYCVKSRRVRWQLPTFRQERPIWTS